MNDRQKAWNEFQSQSYDLQAKILEAQLNVKRIEYEQKNGPAVDSRRIPPASTAVFRPGDVLELKSSTDPSLNDFRVVVNADYTISLALIGTIKVKSLNLEQLTQLLEKSYSPFVRQPDLLVRRYSQFDAEQAIRGGQ